MRTRAAGLTLAAATAFAAAGSPGAIPVALAGVPAGLTVVCLPDTVAANEEGYWTFTVRLANRTALGIFGDSLLLVVEPASAASGEPAPVARRLVMPKSAEALSAGDSVDTQVTVGATARRANLGVRFHSHDGAGTRFTGTGRVVASGSVLEEQFPPSLARVAGRDVEMVKLPSPAEVANGAGVLLLPGEGMDAGEMLVPAWRLARQGLSVVIVASPGRGRSQGPDDFAGPVSSAAALAGLDTLLLMPGLEPARVGVWGVSRGGTLALRLALERPAAFRAVASQSASYDLWATWRAAGPQGRAAIETAAGRDSAAWRARSPLLGAAAFKPEVFVLHGERDDLHPAAPAHAFADAVKAAGGAVLARFLPQGQHVLPAVEPTRFLQSRLSPSP